MELYLQEIAEVLTAKNDVSQYEDIRLQKVEFDSRLIEEGDLFIPLKGARDGHDFIATAFEQGAVLTLSEKVVPYPHILVEDVLKAFQTLAAYYLEKTKVRVLAVTGSNGKTTTKDMLAHLLSQRFETYKTQGNYNNEIGLPYTVLHMPAGCERLVLEMGQDHLGDIHLLSMLAKPQAAIVTIVAEAHLEFFKDRREIAQGKMQIADGMPEGSLLLIPDDELLDEFLPNDVVVKRFGPESDLWVHDLVEEKESLRFTVPFLENPVTLPLTGKYNATNAMIAAYLAKEEGVEEAEIHRAFESLTLTRNRTEWKKAGNGADILSDVYNANPTAMRLILETFASLPANPEGRKLVVLADMKELGKESRDLHGRMILSLNPEVFSHVFLYGEEMEALYAYAKEMFPPNRVFFFKKNKEEDQFEELLKAIESELKPQDQILLKGSNSMNLAGIVDALEK